jgi:hypothetical protein
MAGAIAAKRGLTMLSHVTPGVDSHGLRRERETLRQRRRLLEADFDYRPTKLKAIELVRINDRLTEITMALVGIEI